MQKFVKILPLLIAVSLTACDKVYFREDAKFFFDTTVIYKIKSTKQDENTMVNILKEIEAISDSYHKRDVVGVYDLNQTNEKVKISERLYDLLYWVKEAEKVAPNFNPLVGSLSKLWKESLAKNEVPSSEAIHDEILKINNSELIIEETDEGMFAQRIGEATIDLGGIAKGYALDVCKEYFKNNEVTDYLINAGNSSILFGINSSTKPNTFKGPNPYHQLYSVAINELSNKPYFYTNRSIVSTSGISEQGVTIGNTTYSHIVNPRTGNAINLYDAVVVIIPFDYGNGAIGDALSTSFMTSDLDTIKEAEKNLGIQVVTIKNDEIFYKSPGMELK